ncbi:unnamed protein product [Sphagnum balticum]
MFGNRRVELYRSLLGRLFWIYGTRLLGVVVQCRGESVFLGGFAESRNSKLASVCRASPMCQTESPHLFGIRIRTSSGVRLSLVTLPENFRTLDFVLSLRKF